MFKFINKFRREEDGAITVDWVVLTAGVVGLGIAALTIISGETTQLSADIGATIDADDPFVDMTEFTGAAGDGS